MLDADDALSRHEWLIAPLLLQGSASPDARILLALPVDIDELVQRCPQLVQQSDTVEWDDAQGTLKARRRLQIGQLMVKVQPLAKPSEDELYQAMLNGIRDKGLRAQLDGGSGTATLCYAPQSGCRNMTGQRLMMKVCWRRWKRGYCRI